MKIDKYLPLIWIFIGLSGGFSVLFGAWLAHSEAVFSSIAYEGLSTALKYQQLHVLAMLAVFGCYLFCRCRWLLASLNLFMLGIVFFSGSLYIKILLGWSTVGILTPLGGILLSCAWFALIPASKQLIGKLSL